MSQVRRRRFLITAGALLAAPLAAEAQQAAKVPQIGYVGLNDGEQVEPAPAEPANDHVRKARESDREPARE